MPCAKEKANDFALFALLTPMNLAEKFWEKLHQDGDRIIFVGIDCNGDILWKRTRKDLAAEAAQWMGALLKSGVKPGDRIALSISRSPKLVAAHIAVLSAGAVAVPINSAWTPREVSDVLDRAEISLTITDNTEPSDVYADASPVAETVDVLNGDLALLLFTSGTTGKPKGVGLTHGNIQANLHSLLEKTWHVTESDRFLHALPAHHLHGLVLGLYGSLLIGCSVVMLDRFDASAVLRSIAAHKISLFMGVPTMYHRMLDIEGDFDLTGMRLFTCGSAPLSADVFQRFKDRFGFAAVERYGLTETGINASNPADGRCKAGSVGMPLPEVEIGIFDADSDARLENEAVGEIRVCGPNVFGGYWRDREATEAAFKDGWFRTGDLGAFDSDGYLSILGRIKELIIVGGTNVAPGEVEAILETVKGVAECAVAGMPDPDLGEKIAAFIALRSGEDAAEVETRLRAAAERDLASYKRPHQYFFIDAVPRNAMGKIERNRLKASASDRV